MKKATQNENEYFELEDIEKLHKIRVKKESEENEKKMANEKEIHFMKCSRCGQNLTHSKFGFVSIDKCNNCEAIVISKDELEKFLSEGHSLLKPLIDMFRKS